MTMGRLGNSLVLLAVSLTLTGFSRPLSTAVEGSGTPWWIWIIVFFVLALFVAVVLWWWMRTLDEEEEELP